MRKTARTKSRLILFVLFVISVIIIFIPKGVKADEEENKKRFYLQGDTYELKDGEKYCYSESDLVEEFSYGRKYAGFFYVAGDDLVEKSHGSYVAYGTEETVTFAYEYDNSLHDNGKHHWSIENDRQDMVNGRKLNKNVNTGAVVVERSYDTINWSKVETRRDFFDSHPTGESNIYTTDPDDVKRGAYYRVTIAYKVEYVRNFWEKNTHKECVEVYTFYVGEFQSSLHIKEVYSGGEVMVSDDTTITHGFSLMCDSTESTIFVKGPGDVSEFSVPQYSVFTKAGEYSIRLRTALEDDYKYTLKVKEGVDVVEVEPIAYWGNSSYENLQAMEGSIADRNMTSLFVEQTKGYSIKQAEIDGIPAISVSGEGVALYLQVNYGKEIGKGYQLSSDSYGSKDGQELFGTAPGKIESGALVVKTSKDGNDWTDLDKGRYKDGLFTTDFQNQYGSGRRIQIYTPNGQEVLEGLYVRVLYAYEVTNKDETKNVVEEYTFYLSNSNTNAVLFHNLSVEDKMQEALPNEDPEAIEVYKRAETLEDYTQSVTGFSIDTSLNPTVKYEVKKDGELLGGSATRFTETGKYVITLRSVSDTTMLTIFVDKDSPEESLKAYFGDGFLQGKRVYAETGYPVYVAGQTTYNIQKAPSMKLPIGGEIRNLTTGSVIKIDSTEAAKSDTLIEPGEYQAKFYTNKTFTTKNPIGDTKVFTFRFIVIAEKNVPGPVVNENSLVNYTKTNVTDLCPRYYGLTYSSALRGSITYAFASWEDAYHYAQDQEGRMVEVLEDGTFRYYGECKIEQKIKYDSTWDKDDAIEYFARQAVHEYYFDMSDNGSYTTLPQDILDKEDNLRSLELEYSVVVFGEGQKNKMLASEGLPIISPKKYAYLKDGRGEKINDGYHDFAFVKDDNGYDSTNIIIIDANGNSYGISYAEGVGKQLEEQGCASGKVRIIEVNQYNDKNEYEAVYIREGDNLATVTIETHAGGQKKDVVIDKDSEIVIEPVEAFQPISIVDETDYYSYLQITHNRETFYAITGAMGNKVFTDPGDYKIRCINRLGFSFEFTITIQDNSMFSVLHCMDDKGAVQEVFTSYGSHDVKLPEFVRKGYEIVGYLDAQGNHYPMVISEVSFTGSISLEAEWRAKDCKVVVVDQNNDRIAEISTKYNETVDLAAECKKSGITASGWSVNGENIINGVLLVREENETIVVAIGTELAKEGKTAGNGKLIWIILGILVAGGAASCIVYFHKRGGQNEKAQ